MGGSERARTSSLWTSGQGANGWLLEQQQHALHQEISKYSALHTVRTYRYNY